MAAAVGVGGRSSPGGDLRYTRPIGGTAVTIGSRGQASGWCAVATLVASAPLVLAAGPVTVNDITGLDRTVVEAVVTPTSIAEVQRIVRTHRGPISIGGGRFSMGGQIAAAGALFIDMRRMDRIVALSTADRTITVEAGITWRKIQEAIDPHDLSLRIMQSYSNFTVGGSLSVNVHGRYVNQGPIVYAVRSIEIVLADGSLVEASREKNQDVFFGAIGGYGGLGVIVEATLALDSNLKLERSVARMPITEYVRWFETAIAGSKTALFHNADIYPPDYDTVEAITYGATERAPTIPDRLQRGGSSGLVDRLIVDWVSSSRLGKWVRENVLDPWRYHGTPVVWRNYEASYDVEGLGPFSGADFTYVLQEYFVPAARFDEFVPRMRDVFRRSGANVLNVSIRHAAKDPGTYLAWAREDCFAFVVFYRQATSDAARTDVGVWTRALVDAVLAVGGTYYLPYQIHPTSAQFHAAYPRARELYALKRKLDPTYKFRNALWERYFPPTSAAARAADDAEVRAALLAREGYRRSEDQTYLTLPEWYIVYSADELARYLKTSLPSGFPYLRSIAQFWSVYGAVRTATAGRYPSNVGYHAMIWTIGASFTAEYVVKAVWEGTIGRLAEWVSLADDPARRSAEDRFMNAVAAEYATFIHETPWYAFPFATKLRELWSMQVAEPWTFRRVERRVAATLELGGKAVWGWLLGLATGAAYAPEDLEIRAWVRSGRVDPATAADGVRMLERLDRRGFLVTMPRYERFTQVAPALAARRVRFVEIAGNREILVTMIAPATWHGAGRPGTLVGEWPILTEPERKRVAVAMPVDRIAHVLPRLARRGVEVEHVYDY
jgi:FAD/FMN-containing dehydrogenase